MTIEEHLGLPTDLHDTPALWESRTDTGDGRRPTVRRLYPDGRLFTLGTTVVGLDPNGRPASVTAERRWRQVSLIGDTKAVEAAIREVFLATPDADPTLRVSDGHETTWTATLPDGTRHQVVRRGPAPPAIRAVETAIARGTVKAPYRCRASPDGARRTAAVATHTGVARSSRGQPSTSGAVSRTVSVPGR